MLYFLCASSLRKYTYWLFFDWDRWSDYAAASGLYLAPPPVTGADDHHRDVLESQRPPLWLTDPLSVGRIAFFLKSQISSSCCHLLVLQIVCLRRRLNDYLRKCSSSLQHWLLTAALRCNKADDSSLVWEDANIMKTPLVMKWHQTWCRRFAPARKYK